MTEEYTKEELKKLDFMNEILDLEKRIEDLLARLTLEEKFDLCSGTGSTNPNTSGEIIIDINSFCTKPIKRLGIKKFKMTDGPHGVGPHSTGNKESTYFPTAICRAATWDPELSRDFAEAIAEEVIDLGFHMLLAPGINIHRTPMCGRNFEYQTEDPYLNIQMALPVVKGLQSKKIAACVKHYICNNQETERFTISSEISERTLQEIYIPAFKATVTEADAWSIMSCYNKVNGVYGCENKNLLSERLREEWGFRGFVVTDWYATNFSSSTELAMNAGLTLEMPMAMKFKKSRLKRAITKGKFTEETLNENIRRLLRVMFLVGLFDEESKIPLGSRNTPEHQILAQKIAEEGIVLLKNDNKILPLNIDNIRKIAVTGPNANKKMARGGGSSMVNPPYEITPLNGLEEKCKGKIEIITTPSEAEIVIYIGGLNHRRGWDSEFVDKKSFSLPLRQIEEIKKLSQENPNIIVVLISGSPVSMDEWLDKVPAVIEAWYPGMEGGHAIANILFGDINPSGKLPITFPKKLSDSPAHMSQRTFPGNEKVYYDEGIFVGYRHFDTKNIEPLFPFGYGLSYTTFQYGNLIIDKDIISENDSFMVSCDIFNSGDREGAEVAQLYIQDVECSVERPLKELKGFRKIFLKPGEKTTISFELNRNALSFFDEVTNSWIVESGIFNILIGSSSREIHLKGQIKYF